MSIVYNNKNVTKTFVFWLETLNKWNGLSSVFFRHEQNIMLFYFELWHHIFDKVSKFKLLFAFSFDSLENYPFVQVLAYNFNNLRRRIPVSLPS